MGTTSNYAIRYPDPGASNNVPADIENAAVDVDTNLKTVHDALASSIPPLDSVPSDISTSSPGDTHSAGTSSSSARADHRHARETTATALAGPADLTVYTEALTTLSTSGSTASLDLSTAREFKVTLTGNVTLSFTNSPSVSNKRLSFGVRLIQDGSGSRTVTWPGSVNWGAQGVPVLSTAASKADWLMFISDDSGTSWAGFYIAGGF